MGSCLSRKPKLKPKNRHYKVSSTQSTPLTLCNPTNQSTDSKTEIILRDVSHVTIKLTLNPDDTTTYTISRPKHLLEHSSIEIVNGEKEISITKSPFPRDANKSDSSNNPQPVSPTDILPPSQDAELSPTTQKESSVVSSMLPHPPLRQPSDPRRPNLRFRSQISSVSSSDPSSSSLTTDPSLPSLPSLCHTDSSPGVLTPTLTSEYDVESPLGHSPARANAEEHNSRSLPSNLQTKPPDALTQVRSLPYQDSRGHLSRSTRSLIACTPPLPPHSHRTPITPFPFEGTPLRVPVYENGDRHSYASFPKRVKHPARYHGRFRCKECLWDWTSSYTWEGWGQKCRRCKISNSPCFPYRLDTLQNSAQVTTMPHSPTHCLRCQYLKRNMDKNVTCVSFAATQRPSLAHV